MSTWPTGVSGAIRITVNGTNVSRSRAVRRIAATCRAAGRRWSAAVGPRPAGARAGGHTPGSCMRGAQPDKGQSGKQASLHVGESMVLEASSTTGRPAPRKQALAPAGAAARGRRERSGARRGARASRGLSDAPAAAR